MKIGACSQSQVVSFFIRFLNLRLEEGYFRHCRFGHVLLLVRVVQGYQACLSPSQIQIPMEGPLR